MFVKHLQDQKLYTNAYYFIKNKPFPYWEGREISSGGGVGQVSPVFLTVAFTKIPGKFPEEKFL